MKRIITRSLALFVIAMLFYAPTAMAQGGAGQQQQQQQTPPPEVELEEGELDAVAEAYVAVEEIRAEYQSEFQSVQDPEEAQQLQQELQGEVNEAIESVEGITLDRYDEVVRAAQADPELRQQLIARIESLQGGGEQGGGQGGGGGGQ